MIALMAEISWEESLKTFRMLALAVASVTVSIPLISTPSGAEAAHNSGCTPVAILAFRGSGEKNIEGDDLKTHDGMPHAYSGTKLVTNGWESHTLSRLLKKYAPMSRDGFRADSVPVISVGPPDASHSDGYPAIPAWREVTGSLTTSATQGVDAGLKEIHRVQASQPRNCAPTKFIATGYSQGAMAARQLVQASPANVIGAVNVGDPYQKTNSKGNWGTGKDGNGFVRWDYSPSPRLVSKWDSYYSLPNSNDALCHDGDPICDFNGNPLSVLSADEHKNYFTSDVEVGAQAAKLFNLAYESWKSQQVEVPESQGTADVVFTIDTTGSMQPYIDAAVTGVEAAANQTLKKDPQSRIAVVQYRDFGDDFVSKVVTPFTSDLSQVSSGLKTLVADGGGDWPEAVLSGVVTSAQLDWRDNATRSIVVVGDAPAHDPESETGYTSESVTKLLKAGGIQGTIKPSAAKVSLLRSASTATASSAATEGAEEGSTSSISLYSLSADESFKDSVSGIVSASGGLNFELANAGDLGAALEDAFADVMAAPVADVAAPSVTTEGLTITVSGAATTAGDPDLQYAFDLDGDGTYEKVTGNSSVASTRFDTAGVHKVGLRVTDSRGRVSTDSSEVLVLAPDEIQTTIADPDLHVVATPESVQAGESIHVAVAEDVTPETINVAVVPSGGDPFAQTALVEPTALQDGALKVPNDIPAGTYTLLVGAENTRWGQTEISITAADDQASEDGNPDSNSQEQEGSTASTASDGETQTDTIAATSMTNELAQTGQSRRWIAVGVGLVASGIALVVALRLRRRRA